MDSQNNGGMFYIPPKPIGNIVNFNTSKPINPNDYSGMMGGYYNNNYNNNMSPWEYKQMVEKRELERKQELTNQSNIWKMISKACNPDMENIDEHVTRYDTVYEDNIPNRETQKYLRLTNLAYARNTNRNISYQTNNQKFCALYKEAKENYPDDMSLVEYFGRSGEMYAEMLTEKAMEQQKNLQRLYNSNAYGQLINIHSRLLNNNNVNIDDLTIKLPVKLDGEFARRRKLFLDSILNNK